MTIRKITAALLLAVLFAAPTVRAQTPGTIVCTPTGGQVICEPQATPTAKRLAIVAAVAVVVAVAVYLVHRHKKHADAPTAQPQQSAAPLPAQKAGTNETVLGNHRRSNFALGGN